MLTEIEKRCSNLWPMGMAVLEFYIFNSTLPIFLLLSSCLGEHGLFFCWNRHLNFWKRQHSFDSLPSSQTPLWSGISNCPTSLPPISQIYAGYQCHCSLPKNLVYLASPLLKKKPWLPIAHHSSSKVLWQQKTWAFAPEKAEELSPKKPIIISPGAILINYLKLYGLKHRNLFSVVDSVPI